jgi:predicted MFS family arabinose efflux permease
MPIAFVPIVMAHIYKPVFGLPYEIMISIPITAQIFMSIFSSWVCGAVVARKGWRPVAFFGIAFMIVGAVVAAFSAEPLLFIFSQLIFGFGLGCAKTAFDIFSVISASSENIEAYTSNSNAGIITGLSCSAALGAAIAGVAGYFGAFITMALFGLALLLLIRIFAVNIVQRPHPEEKTVTDNASVPRFDKKFAYYILLLIIPYSFVSMYLDYFFPVYADANGMSTGNIGHVFLLYGIATAYVGTFICNRFSKSVKTALFMASLLLIAGCVMGVFSVYANLALAVAFVLLMGITDGIMPSLQYRYVFSLDISKRYGISRVIGMEGTFAGIIRGVSPFIFSLVMIYGETGLLISSVAVMAAAVILFALNVKKGDALNG